MDRVHSHLPIGICMDSIHSNLPNRQFVYVGVCGYQKRKGQINMLPIIIGLVIAGYTGYLIYRQVKNAKAGNFCGSCGGCPSARTCGEFKESKDMKDMNIYSSGLK